MAFALANAARLKPEIRLAKEVSEFEASLSKEQKTCFRKYRNHARSFPPQITDVMQVMTEVDRQNTAQCFSQRLSRVLEAIQQFVSMGDIIVGSSQNIIACGVWSCVRLTLNLLAKTSSALERFSLLLMRVGCSAPCYHALSLLYPHSKVLQNAMFEYYTVFVRLCQQMLSFSQKSSISQIVSAAGLSNFTPFAENLEFWACTIREQVAALTSQKIEDLAKESSRFFDLLNESFRKDQSATHDSQTNTAEALKQDDIKNLEVLITQLRIKVEGMEVPSTPGLLTYEDYEKIRRRIEKQQHNKTAPERPFQDSNPDSRPLRPGTPAPWVSLPPNLMRSVRAKEPPEIE